MQRVFIIRAFGKKTDAKGREVDFDAVQASLIDPALQACQLAGGTTGEIKEAGNIRADMFALIVEADLVICDITVHNANVFYELGIRHALRKKHTLLLKGDPSADTTPFDLSTDRYLKYPIANPQAALADLIEKIKLSLVSPRDTGSPIFLMLPDLGEADVSAVKRVPLDFSEEVDRAEAAGDKGWLRVIAQDLRGQRFQWEGLRRVAQAQWNLKDYSGSSESWQAVRQAFPSDVQACLALANLLERQYRVLASDALLEASNQMIERVLGNPGAQRSQRAEALALQARNHKTLWRHRFAHAGDAAAARPLAMDPRARLSYEAYLKAFECDLNAFYPAVAALQMGRVLQQLATEPAWPNLFRGDKRAARRWSEDLDEQLPALAQVAAASVRRAREQEPEPQRLWADIAEADLMFLRHADQPEPPDVEAVVQAYLSVLPPNQGFARDAASGQLALFAQLGVGQDLARAVMEALGPVVATHPSPATEHLVVFAGHSLDAPDTPPRFPAAAETHARQLIAEALLRLQQKAPDGCRLTVLASAAPGADILAHEVCAELGIPTRLCLPLPVDDVCAHAFVAADGWRSRFRAIADQHQGRTLLMVNPDSLPRWLLNRPGLDVWERGNRWMMATAQAWGAQTLTLLALWDGQDDGRNGGTAQVVRLAQAAGAFNLEWLDCRQLLT